MGRVHQDGAVAIADVIAARSSANEKLAGKANLMRPVSSSTRVASFMNVRRIVSNGAPHQADFRAVARHDKLAVRRHQSRIESGCERLTSDG